MESLEHGNRGLNAEKPGLVTDQAGKHPAETESSQLSLSFLQLATTDLLINPTSDQGARGLISGIYDGAINEPIAAVKQIFDSGTDPHGHLPESSAHSAGKIVGSIVPFVGLSLLTRKVSGGIFERGANPTIARIMSEQAAAGFMLGSLLTSSQLKPGESLLSARLSQGGVNAATFASMTGAGAALERKLPQFGQSAMAAGGRRISIAALAGASGGVVDAELSSGFKASAEDLAVSALGYAAFGTLMESGSLFARSLMKPRINGERTHGSDSLEKSALFYLAADPKTTIISSPAGWYDRLSSAVYKGASGQTIIVTEKNWYQEAQKLAKEAKRPDLNIVFDKNAAKEAALKGRGADSKPANSGFEDDLSKRARLRTLIEEEFAKNGEAPATALANALRKNRVLLVGEYHVQDSAHRELGAELMPQLKKAGLTHLAIEHSKDFKGKIFTADGRLDTASLPELLQHREFYRLLESARKAGVEVVPVDAPYSGRRDLIFRNQTMDSEIAGILKKQENKVLFWVGNQHLRMLDSGDGPQVAALLKQRGLSVSTFYGQHDNFWREEPLRQFFNPTRAVAVPTDKSPALSSMNWLHTDMPGHNVHRFSEFDYVLSHPHQRPSHWD